jgi:hypothetical protein
MCVSNLRDGEAQKVPEFLPRHIKLDAEPVSPANAASYYCRESAY